MDPYHHTVAGSSKPSLAARKAASALGKGKACLECRKRKVRCDASSPCGGCIRMHKECVYEDEVERIARLQLTVGRLEKKLKTLRETANSADGPKTEAESRSLSPPAHEDTPTVVISPPPASDAADETPELTGDWWKAEDIDPQIQNYLLHQFFDTVRAGYSIDKDRFFSSLRKPTKLQPHPALLNVMYLIACHHSNNDLLTQHEPVFLQRTRVHLQVALENKDRILHFISASGLLSYWYLKQGRFLEAYHEISGTARLAMCYDLHKISSPVWRPPTTKKQHSSDDTLSTTLQGALSAPKLPPPIDAVDLGERINLFWMIVLIDHSTSLVTGLPSNVEYENIQTVWPRSIPDYKSKGAADDDVESVRGLFESTSITPPDSAILKMYQGKSIVLLERVTKFAGWAKGLPSVQRIGSEFKRKYEMLDSAVTRYLISIPPLDILGPRSPASTPTSGRASMNDVVTMAFFTSPPSTPGSASSVIPKQPFPPFLLTRTYGLVSRIHLYDIFCQDEGPDLIELLPGYYNKRFEAAKVVLDDIRALVEAGTDFRKHLMMQGFAWGAVARVFAQHIRKLQQSLPNQDHELEGARKDLADVVRPIRTLAGVFPILEFQLERLQVFEIAIPEAQ